MRAFAAIWTSIESAVVGAFGPSSAYGAPALLGALAFAALYYVGERRARGRPSSVRGFVRSIFPRRVVLHPSSLVDIRLWLMNGVVLASAYGMLSGGLFFWRDAVDASLVHAFGARVPTSWPIAAVLALATALQVLAYELAYWLSHYALHKVPALWEFHKVHHSAEAMTIFTELRQHPVEILLVVNLVGLSTGLVFGAMAYAFGPGVRPFTLLNGNVLMMTFLLTYGHLRHSKIWIAFTGPVGLILHSPAHHQLHHSVDPIHHDKNFGFALSLFDWAFGTLVVPSKRRQPIAIGVGADSPHYRSVAANLLIPFARLAPSTLLRMVLSPASRATPFTHLESPGLRSRLLEKRTPQGRQARVGEGLRAPILPDAP
jgi:sterol desaturase/sphingolipid hydroxylase (fatty acid hydroxylase superfamily)